MDLEKISLFSIIFQNGIPFYTYHKDSFFDNDLLGPIINALLLFSKNAFCSEIQELFLVNGISILVKPFRYTNNIHKVFSFHLVIAINKKEAKIDLFHNPDFFNEILADILYYFYEHDILQDIEDSSSINYMALFKPDLFLKVKAQVYKHEHEKTN